MLASLYFEDIREPERPPLDIAGFFLLGTGLAALMLGLASMGRHLLPASVSWGCLAAGAGCCRSTSSMRGGSPTRSCGST